MSGNVWYMSQGDTPMITGTLEREQKDGSFTEEDLSVATSVTLTLYLANGKAYKTDQPVTRTGGGGVQYVGVAADSQQGLLSGKFRVTYADNSVRSFPNTGRFQIRVSQ